MTSSNAGVDQFQNARCILYSSGMDERFFKAAQQTQRIEEENVQ
jgi:hypothetical protein